MKRALIYRHEILLASPWEWPRHSKGPEWKGIHATIGYWERDSLQIYEIMNTWSGSSPHSLSISAQSAEVSDGGKGRKESQNGK